MEFPRALFCDKALCFVSFFRQKSSFLFSIKRNKTKRFVL